MINRVMMLATESPSDRGATVVCGLPWTDKRFLVPLWQGLVTLATLVQGDLEVSKDGDLVYKFPPGFRTALRTRSVTQRAKEVRSC